LLLQQDRLDEAHSLLEEVVHSCSNNALYQNDLGVVRYRLNDITGAQGAYEQAVKLQPDNANFQKNLADLYYVELGKTDEAISIYLKLLDKYPRDVETLSALGQICTSAGHPEQAKSFYRRAMEIEPWNKLLRELLH
jgi:Flp pilus assembly protein TadD